MVNINLFPWRHHLARHQQQKIYQVLCLLACLNALMFLAIHVYFAYHVKLAKTKIASYRQSLGSTEMHLARKSQQLQMLAKNEEKLPTVRQMLALLKSLDRLRDHNVCFTTINSDAKQLQLKGVTSSLSSLVSLLLEQTHDLQYQTIIGDTSSVQLDAFNHGFQFHLIGRYHAQ